MSKDKTLRWLLIMLAGQLVLILAAGLMCIWVPSKVWWHTPLQQTTAVLGILFAVTAAICLASNLLDGNPADHNDKENKK